MDGPKTTNKVITELAARQKAEHFCAYQERSQQEVRDKLYEWGLHAKEVESIISALISDNFINEERFSSAYALGKFRQKGWGKLKIKQGLKLKKVPDVLIKKALQGINDVDYALALKKLLDKKAVTINEKNTFRRSYKLRQYALSRGFEADLIADMLKESAGEF